MLRPIKKIRVSYFIKITICLSIILFITGGCGSLPTARQPKSVSQPKTHVKYQPKPYRVEGKWYQPIKDAKGFSQKGIASWYGKKFHGRKTSNGEIYNMYAMTAAHKTLPHGTYVRVHNLENGKKTDVRINDRGPFVRGRIIDMSYTGAKKLGMAEKGTAKVKVVALGVANKEQKTGERQGYIPGDYYSGNFTFQIGAFSDHSNAERLKQDLDQRFKNVHILSQNTGTKTLYRVRIGTYHSLDDILKDEPLIQEHYPGAIIVAE